MKAKLSIKKALSLIVALVMLLTMIPVGMISVGADEPTIDLSNYDYDTEYVINNVEDWILIAREAQDKDFSGKTIKLGADLDFGAYTSIWDESHVPAEGEFPNAMYCGQKPGTANEIARQYAATVPTLFNNFAGAFDGQGYTIRNARFEEGGIARVALDGAEVTNVTFENACIADFYDFFAFGLVAGEVKGSFWMENVHAVDSMVQMNSAGTIHTGSAGTLIGLISAAEDVEGASVAIYDCSVDADVSAGNYKAWGYGYGTGMIVGTVDANVDFEMAYCSVSGSLESLDWYCGAIGALYVGKEKTAVINNITIDGLTMNSNRGAVTDGNMSWGALAGVISTYDNASVVVDSITVLNTTIKSDSHAIGGAIGSIQPLNSPYTVGGPVANNSAGGTYRAGSLYAHETVEGASIVVSNVYVDAFLWCDSVTGGGLGAAGLIAQVGEGNNSGDSAGRVWAGELNVYNIYIGGTIIAAKYDATLDTWTVKQGAGGLFFVVSLAYATINVNNVVLDAAFPVNDQYAEAPENLDELLEAFTGEDAAAAAAAKAELEIYSSRKTGAVMKCVGLLANAATIRQKTAGDYVGGNALGEAYMTSDLNATNIATTLRGDFNLFCWLNRKGSINYNGEYIGRGDDYAYAPPVENTDGAIVQVRPNEAKQMVQLDENGFVTRVTGALGLIGVQAAGDDIRFVASAYVDSVVSATATVTFTDADFNEKTFTFDSVSLLDGLTAVEGTEIAEYDAEDFYAKKFMAVTIKNIPADTEYTVTWSFEYTTEDGATVTSEIATGTLYADGSFEF